MHKVSTAATKQSKEIGTHSPLDQRFAERVGARGAVDRREPQERRSADRGECAQDDGGDSADKNVIIKNQEST